MSAHDWTLATIGVLAFVAALDIVINGGWK